MTRVLVLNGPNLGRLGRRQPEIYGSTTYAELAELCVERLAPINAEMRRLLDNPSLVDSILADGAKRARVIARETMGEVRRIMGFLGG